MQSTASDLVTVIYGLYCYECLHWLKQDERACVRKTARQWRRIKNSQFSYTLLGRKPFFVNPFLLSPSIRKFPCTPELRRARQRRQTSNSHAVQDQTDIKHLTWAATAQAIILLVLAPLLIGSGLLDYLWPSLLILLVSSQVLLLTFFWIAASRWRTDNPKDFAKVFVSIALNPIAGIRSGDYLSMNSILL